MIIYRGLKNILFCQIDPFYIGSDDNTYGLGTSYSLDINQAKDYCNFISVSSYGWILSY